MFERTSFWNKSLCRILFIEILCQDFFYKSNSQNICFAAKLVPVGYGIRKLQINAVIEDEKVNCLKLHLNSFSREVLSLDQVSFSDHPLSGTHLSVKKHLSSTEEQNM